jgi:L-asparaginase II
MCHPAAKDTTGNLKAAGGVRGLATVALLGSTIGLALKENNAAPAAPAAPAADTMSAVAAAPSTTDFVALKENSIFLDYRDNVCAELNLQ